MKLFLAVIIILSALACKNYKTSSTQPIEPDLSNTNKDIKDSLDIDTTYAQASYAQGIGTPDSVSLFFRRAHDTLWNYVMRSFIRSNKKEVFSIDSFNSILEKNGYEFFACDSSFCGFKQEFNKRYRFQLELSKAIRLTTTFEYWFNGESYRSPMEMHLH